MATFAAYPLDVSSAASLQLEAGLDGTLIISQALINNLNNATSNTIFEIPFNSIRDYISVGSNSKNGQFKIYQEVSLDGGATWNLCCGVGFFDSTLTVDGAVSSGATSIPLVSALDQDVAAKTNIYFATDDVTAILSAKASAGDTSLSVNALSGALSDTSSATINGTSKTVHLFAQTVTTSASAAISDTSISVTALTNKIEAGTLLIFSADDSIAVVRSEAAIGATSVLVAPLTAAISSGSSAIINKEMSRDWLFRIYAEHEGDDVVNPFWRVSFTNNFSEE